MRRFVVLASLSPSDGSSGDGPAELQSAVETLRRRVEARLQSAWAAVVHEQPAPRSEASLAAATAALAAPASPDGTALRTLLLDPATFDSAPHWALFGRYMDHLITVSAALTGADGVKAAAIQTARTRLAIEREEWALRMTPPVATSERIVRRTASLIAVIAAGAPLLHAHDLQGCVDVDVSPAELNRLRAGCAAISSAIAAHGKAYLPALVVRALARRHIFQASGGAASAAALAQLHLAAGEFYFILTLLCD